MNCPNCGQPILPGALQCARCGQTLTAGNPHAPQSPNPFADRQVYEAAAVYPPPRPAADDPALRLVIPIGQSPWAVAAGYVGLFSIAICFLGPVAVLLGILGLRQIKRNPQMHGGYRAIVGIVLGALSSLGFVAMIIAILAEG
jgi:hypothetical protein